MSKSEEPSKAVIASDGNGQGCVIWFSGESIRIELKEAGLSALDDLGLDDAPQGISIWEGWYHYTSGGYYDGGDGSSEAEGSFRLPTDEEWSKIRTGLSPWEAE